MEEKPAITVTSPLLPDLGELDAFDQYTYLMGLAMKRPELSGVPREEEYRFLGCQSNLWVSLEEEEGLLRMRADSDTLIVKGMAVMLADMFTGAAPQEAAQAHIDLFQRLDLEVALTSVRRNGFTELIRFLQNRAAALAEYN